MLALFNLEKLEILAVEDGLDNQLLLKLFLKDYPCYIDMATQGEEAVWMFSRKHYDVVLMDMHMPVMNGCAAASEIRKIEKQQNRGPAQLVAMTANTTDEQIRKSAQAGCNHFLHKPLSQRKLWALLNQFWHNPVQLVLIKDELQDLIPGYIEHRCEDLRRIAQLLIELDYENIEAIGHKMKGSGSGYGLNVISLLGKVISTAAADRNNSKIVDAVLDLADYLENLKIIYTNQDDED